MSNQEKFAKAVEIAQSYILLFLKDYLDEEQLQIINEMFSTFPIKMEEIVPTKTNFNKVINTGGLCNTREGITISARTIDLSDENELNDLLGIIIHEYAHKIRSINSRHGGMFEEAFANVFAEVCINNARLKSNNNKDNNLFEIMASYSYRSFGSQARGILYILKQHKLDKLLIAAYITGNQKLFLDKCVEIFGESFIDYYNEATKLNNTKSEEMLIKIITEYIKKYGLSIADYWSKDNRQLSPNNIYFRGSQTLDIAISKAGEKCFSPEEQQHYKKSAYTASVAIEEREFVIQEKVNRIKKHIETTYSLKGKTAEELNNTIINLCRDYIQYKDGCTEEGKIFIEELTKFIPFIDDFVTKFIKLRNAFLDETMCENLDSENITYYDIYLRMTEMLELNNGISKC